MGAKKLFWFTAKSADSLTPLPSTLPPLGPEARGAAPWALLRTQGFSPLLEQHCTSSFPTALRARCWPAKTGCGLPASIFFVVYDSRP